MSSKRLIQQKIMNAVSYDYNHLQRRDFLKARPEKVADKSVYKLVRWKELIKEEKRLDKRSMELNRKLGIYLKDPCSHMPRSCQRKCYFSVDGDGEKRPKNCPYNKWDDENKPISDADVFYKYKYRFIRKVLGEIEDIRKTIFLLPRT